MSLAVCSRYPQSIALHPEAPDITEADCKLVTLENILTTGMYNDIGLQVRDKMILLIEAQSTFSVNIVLRMLLYLAATYKEYVEEQKLNLYGTEAVTVPRPELYVVYTGSRKEVAEIMVTLFDQEKVMEIHDYHVAEAARRDGLQEGRAEGRAEGVTGGILKALKSLMKNSGVTFDEAMTMLSIPETDRFQYAEKLKQ